MKMMRVHVTLWLILLTGGFALVLNSLIEKVRQEPRNEIHYSLLPVDMDIEAAASQLDQGPRHRTNGFGTYTSQVRPDGMIYGEGEGAFMTKDGEAVTWKGSGLGKFKEGGAVSYRGILYHRTTSQKLARLNTTAVVFEYEVDAKGDTSTKFWEWK